MKYTGDTVDAALSKGLADLNVGRSQVEVTVISEGRKGFLGIGKKAAAVEINVLTPSDQIDDEYSSEIENQITAEIKKSEENETDENKEKKHLENTLELDEAIRNLGDYLNEITAILKIDADISVTVSHRKIYFDFEASQPGLLIGKHGKTINALQILAQAFLDKQIKQRYRVLLDVDNYREKRQAELKKISLELAQRAIIERRAFKLGPMPATERKIVHKTLASNHHIRAKSHGNDPYRYIVIAPKFK